MMTTASGTRSKNAMKLLFFLLRKNKNENQLEFSARALLQSLLRKCESSNHEEIAQQMLFENDRIAVVMKPRGGVVLSSFVSNVGRETVETTKKEFMTNKYILQLLFARK